MEIIKTSGLTKFYGKARGIQGVDLAVEQGDFFGFIGPNGAGKSTTIRTLLGLIRPSSGSAEIFGKDVMKHREEILADLGYLPSEAAFYRNMRVGELLRFSAALRKKDCAREAEALCERLRLDKNRRIRELSLGNRKKAAIVCALQHRPDLGILDEPTSGLDPLIQREFFRILEERAGEGATIFLSSHVLSEVQRHCRRAAVIREGRVIACDRVEALGRANARRVVLRGTETLPELPEIKDAQRLPEGVSFLYGGDVNRLLAALAAMRLTDISITEPDLEEIFMHYYEKEDRQ